jgi:2-polyprenyl-3-methyl-5-hydroxy-6-metoxy-1,4-benzoquinol methylase
MITTWSRGSAEHNMPEELLVELTELTHAHPWWHARAKLTRSLLHRLGLRPPSHILDAGCGWGITLEHLERVGYRVDGMDISRRALELLDRPGRALFEADLEAELPEITSPYEAVLALDVLEHLDDDHGAARRLLGLVRPGGWLIVSVPALPELHSEFDEVQGHRRRYLPETLRAVFDGAPLASLETFWWGSWMVPILRRQRRQRISAPVSTEAGGVDHSSVRTYREYLELPPWPGPALLRLAFACERLPALAKRLRVGTSLFAVARRGDE